MERRALAAQPQLRDQLRRQHGDGYHPAPVAVTSTPSLAARATAARLGVSGGRRCQWLASYWASTWRGMRPRSES